MFLEPSQFRYYRTAFSDATVVFAAESSPCMNFIECPPYLHGSLEWTNITPLFSAVITHRNISLWTWCNLNFSCAQPSVCVDARHKSWNVTLDSETMKGMSIRETRPYWRSASSASTLILYSWLSIILLIIQLFLRVYFAFVSYIDIAYFGKCWPVVELLSIGAWKHHRLPYFGVTTQI